MTFVPSPGTVRIHQRATLHGQEIENVHYVYTGGSTGPSDVATAAHAEWITNVLPTLSNNYILRETYAVALDSDTAPTATATTVPNPTGGISEFAVPGGVCLCVSLRTSGRGRSSRGRQYISGLPETALSGNQFLQSFADNVVDGFQQYADTLGILAGGYLAVVSTIENGVPRTEGLVQQVTAILLTDLNIDSQRRRLTGRGS